MSYIVDSREQKWDHVREYLDCNGVLWLRSKLPVGDYARMDNLTTVIDRKQNLNEVESNLIHQHERFRRECELAASHGIHLIVLVEEDKIHDLDQVAIWENPRRRHWEKLDREHSRGINLHKKISGKPPVNGVTLWKMMQTMADKYGIEWRFCPHNQTGATICAILANLPSG